MIYLKIKFFTRKTFVFRTFFYTNVNILEENMSKCAKSHLPTVTENVLGLFFFLIEVSFGLFAVGWVDRTVTFFW